jgi:lipopolysaccharide biosynthesis glycosyltransferase
MVNIVYSANYKYFKQILISAVSIANHASEPICVHILTVDLTRLKPHFLAVTEGQRKYLEDILKTKNPENQVKLFDINILLKTNAVNPFVIFSFNNVK